MNNNLTEVVFILDRSGSMKRLEDETIGGFNSMLEKQKADNNGEVRVTTVLFDNRYEVLHNHVDIGEIQPITTKEYFARGMTALLDAVGITINSVGERLANTPENERPANVIFIITTDGYENASREFSQEQIKEMIKHQREKYNWTFIFLGANIEAEKVGESYGIDRSLSKTYTASCEGTRSVYSVMSDTISTAKKLSSRGAIVTANTLNSVMDKVE